MNARWNVLKKKEYLNKLPNQDILEGFITKPKTRKVSKESMILYNKSKYSVNKYIGKNVVLDIKANTLYIYYNKELIANHIITTNKLNYKADDMVNILKTDAFKNKDDEYIEEHMSNHYLDMGSKTFYDFINDLSLRPKIDEPNNVVKLMAIHQSKWLEAKVVFIVDARDEMMSGKKKGINLEEECRAFYVAITRAKEELYLVTTEKNGPNDLHRCVASRFISEIYK